jgi:NAD(P) transhydrogenase subunit alpha
MKIGIPKESHDDRVAMVPVTMKKIQSDKVEFLVEKEAGNLASLPNNTFSEIASIVEREEIFKNADIIVSVNPLPDDDLAKIKKGTLLISMFAPYVDDAIIGKLKEHGLQGVSMDMIPRTTLAQAMDILSSMAAIAGYKAVLTAANHLPRYFPMMITAAGSIRPAKVLVLGAGVAGLQAIATARRLGAMVEAFDVRKAAKEEVESLGAKFIEVEGAADDKAAG